MAGGKQKKELLIGVLTLSGVLALLVVIALGVAFCSVPGEPEAGSTASQPTQATEPTLIANPYGPGDFGYQDGFITCKTGKSELGIDVSSHQGTIDWQTVAGEGIRFAMVRLGYRGWGNGEMLPDENALVNLQGAADAGLQVGAYFYSQAINVEEARQEAQYVLDILEGRQLSMPVVFDWEIFNENGRTAYVDSQTVNECAIAFCEIIEAAGYEPMVYFNLDVARRLLDLPLLQQKGYGFWLALYSDMTYTHRVDMWQFSTSGRVKGIDGEVDMNLYFTYE